MLLASPSAENQAARPRGSPPTRAFPAVEILSIIFVVQYLYGGVFATVLALLLVLPCMFHSYPWVSYFFRREASFFREGDLKRS